MLAGSPFLKPFSVRCPSFLGNSAESWTVANLYMFLWILAYSLDRVAFHTCLLERIILLLSIVRNLHSLLFFALGFALGCSSGFLKLSLTRRETLLTNLTLFF